MVAYTYGDVAMSMHSPLLARVCVCVCVSVCECVCASVCACVLTHIYIYIFLYVCVCLYLKELCTTSSFFMENACFYTRLYLYLHTYICIYMQNMVYHVCLETWKPHSQLLPVKCFCGSAEEEVDLTQVACLDHELR